MTSLPPVPVSVSLPPVPLIGVLEVEDVEVVDVDVVEVDVLVPPVVEVAISAPKLTQ
jgi:hypothetical protein